MSTVAPNFLSAQLPAQTRVLIVSPHPDDEIIGAGSMLLLLNDVIVAQVTDGSPRDLSDANASGFSLREDYAQARHSELLAALALAGHSRVIDLNIPDQEASLRLVSLTHKIVALIIKFQPDTIVTVPYEGGHPDHDATAFAVHNALELLGAGVRPQLLEMTAYHNSPIGCTFNTFLNPNGKETTIHLTSDECALKRRMFDCFRTQAHVLKWFPIGVESFRSAPRYDFFAPPHPGTLYYENFNWGMTGARWRELAREALEQLHTSTVSKRHLAFA